MNASVPACRRRPRSTPTSSWPRPSTCGISRPRARSACTTRARSRSRSPNASSCSTPTRTTWCSTRSWDRARPWSRRPSTVGGTSATTSTPSTSTSAALAECEDVVTTPLATDGGKPAAAMAAELIEQAGFTITHRNRKLRGTGLTVSYTATDADGRPWFFDVSGAFTISRDGMLRTDTVWRSLGRAHVLAHNNPDATPLVFLTSDLPRPGSEATSRCVPQDPRRSSMRSRYAMRTVSSGSAPTRAAARRRVRCRLLDSARPRPTVTASFQSSSSAAGAGLRGAVRRAPRRPRLLARGRDEDRWNRCRSRPGRHQRSRSGRVVRVQGQHPGQSTGADAYRHPEEGCRERRPHPGDRGTPAVHRADVAPADGRCRTRDAQHRRRRCGYFADVVCIYDPGDHARLKHL